VRVPDSSTCTASHVAAGYDLDAGLMILGGAVELALGVQAEGKSLEDIAAPLSAGDPARS
jgi:hypothetical protein